MREKMRRSYSPSDSSRGPERFLVDLKQLDALSTHSIQGRSRHVHVEILPSEPELGKQSYST
jgi:hypothetical protein